MQIYAKICLTIFLCLPFAWTASIRDTSGISSGYDGFQIFEVTSKSIQDLHFLQRLYTERPELDFLTTAHALGQSAHIMLPHTAIYSLLHFLRVHHMHYKVVNINLAEIIRADFETTQRLRQYFPYKGTGRLSSNRYYTYNEILQYVDDLGRRFPSRVFVKTVGKSYENRLLKTITITNGDRRPNKNVIFIDGGFHAREWISHSSVLYIIEQLTEDFESNADLLQDYDWVILPVVNPDGYELSQKIEYRFWRKTVQPYEHQGDICWGADPNRNFDFHWMEEGASSWPCANIYAGPRPYSEPEAMVVRDLLLTYKGRGKMYLTIHSYGNMLLYPWGYAEELPETWPELDEVARAGAKAIFEATGTVYVVGGSTTILYPASGASDDYAFHVGFPLSFTMELPRGGESGFDPPATSIDSIVKETWIGVRALSVACQKKFPLQ